ncbi:hypothetical protein BV898_02976 [Hypsibius exemplaris]|uniref:Uncharacterized protein n=1 Tax=Hypsibius exemplaris TaxID=2072580 RepID=A0A1W0X6U6_HYPEX|nr:hypothetical protein BV898_02976 [Hypsibius exemplaris]
MRLMLHNALTVYGSFQKMNVFVILSILALLVAAVMGQAENDGTTGSDAAGQAKPPRGPGRGPGGRGPHKGHGRGGHGQGGRGPNGGRGNGQGGHAHAGAAVQGDAAAASASDAVSSK